jgi:hypothetical protein
MKIVLSSRSSIIFASRRQLDSLLQSLLHIRSFDLQVHTPIRPLIPVYIDFLT